jgi:cellulose synthase/poly-beta-1,6-N-acetylglucosamine synthase-like glycosyltransferase
VSGPVLLFSVSLAAFAYPYFGYPAILWLWSRFRSRPVSKAAVRPPVTLVIPARNEAELIREKLRNTLALEYPRDRLEVLVVSDGSSDRTEAIVDSFDDAEIRLVSLPPGGKARALNVGAARARGEILVFTDADILLEPGALVHLAENFADPEVGGACGNKRYRPAPGGDATGTGEGLYWKFDKWQKRLESRIGSVFGADGALHAVRRELYVPIDDPSHADDLAISSRVVLQGRRVVYEPEARTSEEAPGAAPLEFRRKVRIANQSFRALVGLGRGLWRYGFYSFQLVSHKLLRYLVPFFLIVLFLSSLALAGTHPFFTAALAAQIAVYGLGAVGFLLRGTRPGRWRLFALPFYFCFVNVAALLGVLSVANGRRQLVWASRGRAEEAS